jgi:hypothetical protein
VLLAIAASRRTDKLITEGVADAVGFGEAEGATVGFATFTPLFHASFVPDLMQVYRMPAEIVVELSLLHVVPALAAALVGAISCDRNNAMQIEASKRRFIGKL